MNKLWSFFAYPDPSFSIVTALASTFVSNGMDIAAVVRAVFMRPEFRSEKAKTGLIKSPIEYGVSVMNNTGLRSIDLRAEWALKPLGQQPYYPLRHGTSRGHVMLEFSESHEFIERTKTLA